MEIEGKIGPKKWQQLPKKVVINKKINVETSEKNPRGPYTVSVSLWIMDIPYSTHKPGLSITLAHGRGMKRQYLRIVFQGVDALLLFLAEVATLVIENREGLEKTLQEAVKEWELTWKKVIEAKQSVDPTVDIGQLKISQQEQNINK